MFFSKLEKANRLFSKHKYASAQKAYLLHAKAYPADASIAYARAGKCALHFNKLTAPVEVADGAMQLIFRGDREAASFWFRKALSLDPQNLEALMGLADALPKKSEERLELMLRILALTKRYMTFIDVGDFYRDVRKDPQLAYDYYRMALEHRDWDKTVYMRLVKVCEKLGRTDEAKQLKQQWKALYAKKRNRRDSIE